MAGFNVPLDIIMELLIELTFSFVNKFKLSTDALFQIDPNTNLIDKIHQMIYNTKVHGLVQKTRKRLIFKN